MVEWQPIETAPRNEKILCADIRDGQFCEMSMLEKQYTGYVDEDGEEWLWQYHGFGYDCTGIEPTHWMPLPEPPQ